MTDEQWDARIRAAMQRELFCHTDHGRSLGPAAAGVFTQFNAFIGNAVRTSDLLSEVLADTHITA